ncbi:hypothetical protein PVK06_040454 [Gossypium arboreum]|uniref:Uncharacterized protein n=1 Tax=Gossypium arboreum TaxID=29729 RepID=A0ABR0N7N3_GOSAR|nr:hypothetical protein PVK06_040454 [Gossypium arboreum]
MVSHSCNHLLSRFTSVLQFHGIRSGQSNATSPAKRERNADPLVCRWANHMSCHVKLTPVLLRRRRQLHITVCGGFLLTVGFDETPTPFVFMGGLVMGVGFFEAVSCEPLGSSAYCFGLVGCLQKVSLVV